MGIYDLQIMYRHSIIRKNIINYHASSIESIIEFGTSIGDMICLYEVMKVSPYKLDAFTLGEEIEVSYDDRCNIFLEGEMYDILTLCSSAVISHTSGIPDTVDIEYLEWYIVDPVFSSQYCSWVVECPKIRCILESPI